MTEKIFRPSWLESHLFGGKQKVEAYEKQAFAVAEAEFMGVLAPYVGKITAVGEPKTIVLRDENVPTSTSVTEHERNVIKVGNYRVVVDAGHDTYHPRSGGRRYATSSYTVDEEAHFEVLRTVLEAELIDKGGKLGVGTVKFGSKKVDELEVQKLNWEDTRLAVKLVAVNDIVKKAEVLNFAASKIREAYLSGK